jgi:hypothetical protein
MNNKTSFYMAVAASVLVFTSIWASQQRPAPLDPNTVPFPVDANAYTADLLDWYVSDGNSIVGLVNAHNKGGWATQLDIVMADGTPTSTVIQQLTPKPVKDPNGGFNLGFQWGWTPPAEGIFYLELRLSTKSKPTWKGDRRTVVVWAGKDEPFLWVRDIPILRLAEAQKLWQHAKKLGRPLTKPTRVWR